MYEDQLRRLGLSAAYYAPDGEKGAEQTPDPKAAAQESEEGEEDEAVEGEAEPEKKADKPDWKDRRIGRLTGKLATTEAQLKIANDALAKAKTPPAKEGEEPAKKDEKADDEDLETKANKRAQEIASANEFNREANTAAEDGRKRFKDFDDVCSNFTKVGGLVKMEQETGFWSAVLETDDPAAVFYALGKDLDKVEEVLAMKPRRMAIELNKIAEKGIKKVSKAADPPDPEKGGEALPEGLSDKLPMEEWARRRQKQLEKNPRKRLMRTA